jgi:peroxiredoxin
MAGSFPATYVWQEITDRGWDDHATVVGVSIATPYAHRDLIRERGLEDGDYALFSDPGNGVADAFGITYNLDGMAGIAEPRPAVYLVDADRTVTHAWVATEWPAFPDYEAIQAALNAD